MLGFSPFKKRANKFNYIPRYYDPEKEAREQRRAELRGERAEDADREYRPGQYIRTQREARAARREKTDKKGQNRIWYMIGGTVVVMLFIYILYPKLADIFIKAMQPQAAQTEMVQEDAASARGGLDQSGVSDVEWQEQPITVVPNDYQE
ncbi:hypothetical protein [uncultured Alistipes sp.]|uniref:hypothetical protein n=1 Tax=uncultured Alistipes sp. TaxID=538949 RepID=UPI0025DC9152|nr:hypothetical protein [uncultured Alistipes sp.]